MDRQTHTKIFLFSAVAVLFFCIMAGRQFFAFISGPEPTAGHIDLGELEGEYVSYYVTHPVASFVEEYYSGDAGRASKMAYVTYDEERQVFLKVVVPDRKKGNLEHLMKAVNRSEELKASWGDKQASEERPIEVTGTLAPLGDEAIQEAMDALAGPDSQSTGEMDSLASAQLCWYVIEDKNIGGFLPFNLWMSMVTAGLNVLIFLLCLLSLIRKNEAPATPRNPGSPLEAFWKQQTDRVEPWCGMMRAKRGKMALQFLLGSMAVLTILGFVIRYPVAYVLTVHLPMGIFVGELAGALLWLGAKVSFSPDKIIKNLQTDLKKQVPVPESQEALARELVDTNAGWAFMEKGNEGFKIAMVGERHWVVLFNTGKIAVVDSQMVEKIHSEVESGQIRSGKVRINYTYYIIQIHCLAPAGQKGKDVRLSFETEDGAGNLVNLIQKRLGDRADRIIR
ncbi:MAG: hypothetical protein HFG60_10515 [Lachnospiraceae bacterium]|nr:hypothetical protein [Lachnospiraceae bacterium]